MGKELPHYKSYRKQGQKCPVCGHAIEPADYCAVNTPEGIKVIHNSCRSKLFSQGCSDKFEVLYPKNTRMQQAGPSPISQVFRAGLIGLIILALVVYKFYFAYTPGFGDENDARIAAIAYTARLVENSSWQASQTRDQYFNGQLTSSAAKDKLTEYREQLTKTEDFYKTAEPIPAGLEKPAAADRKALDRYGEYLDKLEKFISSNGKEVDQEALKKLEADTLWAAMETSVFFENSSVEANAIQGKVKVKDKIYTTSFKIYRGY